MGGEARRARSSHRVVHALLSVVVMGACASSNDGASGIAAVRGWDCEEQDDPSVCTCAEDDPSTASASGGIRPGARNVSSCGSYTCCLGTHTEAGWRCTCEQLPNCSAEAASRRNTEVVETCPPGGAVDSSRCAARGENCRPDYLSDLGLTGCCAGLECAEVDGVPVCTDAPSTSCLEGMQQPCDCPDGSVAAQTCVGGAFTSCDCNRNTCGNAQIDLGEQCDGTNLNGETCATATMMAFPAGTLTCSPECQLVTASCQAPAP